MCSALYLWIKNERALSLGCPHFPHQGQPLKTKIKFLNNNNNIIKDLNLIYISITVKLPKNKYNGLAKIYREYYAMQENFHSI